VGDNVAVTASRLEVVPENPEVELLWWQGCPSTDEARRMLRAALDGSGLSAVVIRTVEVRTDEQARELRFRGSPTIRIDGTDVVELAGGDDPSAGEPAALTCRLYRRRDGRISPTPDPHDVRVAIELSAEARRLSEEVA